MKTHCADVSLPRKFQPSVYYEPGTESNVLESPDGPDSKGWNPLFLSSRAAQPTVRHLWSIVEIGLEQLGTFRCFFLFPLFFFIPPPFSSTSFPFLLSFFLSFFPSLGWMSLFYSGRNKGREPATPGNIPFLKKRRGRFSNERILDDPWSVAEKGWTHGGGGEGGEGRVSARNRSLTAVLHELSLSLSLSFSTFPSFSSWPMVIARAMPRRATPRDARRSYGPPGVPGHSSGNRSASVARGTR